MRIQHNIPAMAAYRNYTTNVSSVSKNLEKLSSGYKINRAGDDAAGLAISEKMRAQISGLEQAQSNAKSGINLVQTAEGALTEVHDMLNRMFTLAEQSANGTYDDSVDRVQLQKEVEQLRDEIDRIADSSNFNGIKLLNGELSDTATATKIDIAGVTSSKSAGSKGVYKSVNQDGGYPALILDQDNTGMVIGKNDYMVYSVSLSDGTSYSAKLTLAKDATGSFLLAEDGTRYACNDQAKIDSALIAEWNKAGLAEKFKITANNGVYTFEALDEGTGAPGVDAFDAKWTHNGEDYLGADAEAKAKKAIGVDPTAPTDSGREIKATDITEYDGKNYEDAVFTINGKKFVLLTETMDGTTSNGVNDEYLRATTGLGKDVTILIGGQDGLTKNNGNFKQNIEKIAKVTGLTVTDAIAEATATGAGPGEGIRLSIGSGTSDKSLTLQIGDTADSFNQLKVSIKDCHADAMGIGDIDIGTQEGAKEAMNAIKDAINYVSDVRGTLGATQNRLDHTINNLSVMQENIQDAESTIRDVDVAQEMMAYTKNNILVQSAQAMLAQANQLPQGVLQLLG